MSMVGFRVLESMWYPADKILSRLSDPDKYGWMKAKHIFTWVY